jgi:predicted Zn finger-like uncharacterized protein
MILTCPQCQTRYQADATRFPVAGPDVRCAKCGHVWRQMPPQPEPEPDLGVVEPVEAPQPEEPAPQPQSFTPPDEVRRPPPVREREREPVHVEQQPPRPGWSARLAQAGGWLALGIVILVVGWVAIFFRRDVATLWPQSASLYKAVGLSVNASGIQFVGVSNKLVMEDGAHVLVVSGKLVNSSTHELPVPQIRIGLQDAQKRELYHWPVIPTVPTLRPGQSAPFLTRLANPPGAVHDVEVTFARPGE